MSKQPSESVKSSKPAKPHPDSPLLPQATVTWKSTGALEVRL
ncbi:MAG: hypothetical protein WCJ09_09455 [Planctomycetota bacterium]